MKFDPQKHHRHSIRRKEYDYTQPGGYFVTIVTYQRDCLFGKIVDEEALSVGAQHAEPLQEPNVKPGSLGAIVRSFKSAVTRRIGQEFNTTGIWQRNYYEHIIRNHEEWDRIHRYIETNPSRWTKDEENPMNV